MITCFLSLGMNTCILCGCCVQALELLAATFLTSKVCFPLCPSSWLPMNLEEWFRAQDCRACKYRYHDPNLQTRLPQTIKAAFSAVSKACLPMP